MKVRLRGLMKGPEYHVEPGQVADLPEALAKQLLKTGQADAVKEPETADSKKAGETATQ